MTLLPTPVSRQAYNHLVTAQVGNLLTEVLSLLFLNCRLRFCNGILYFVDESKMQSYTEVFFYIAATFVFVVDSAFSDNILN